MEDLHAAIARFLRAQHPAPPPVSGSRVPQYAGPGHFVCRFCGLRVFDGRHGEAFHFRELWEAVSCAACHRERLRQEAQVSGPAALLRQGWHNASAVPPRCRQCGEVIRDGRGLYPVEKLRAERVCADCYIAS